MSARQPLCVDLDGTLVRTDTLHEQALRCVKKHPWRILLLPAWLSRGRANLKRHLAELAPLDPASLPYREDLVKFLRMEKAAGRRLVLVTAADERIARAIASHVGLFDEVFASDGTRNLKGAGKAEVLVARFGSGGFVYAGDSNADLRVWRHSSGSVVVGWRGEGLRRRVEAAGIQVEAVFLDRRRSLRSLIRAMRPYQWVKNLLVFFPAVLAHVFNLSSMAPCIAIFASFCATASGIYLLNDLSDLDSDRQHPRKRRRPFASGDLPLLYGLAGPVLILLGLCMAAAIGVAALAAIGVYILANAAYSAGLKRYPLMDVFLLAALYTIRLVAGGIASGTTVSLWLLEFSSFLFLSLAFVKRFGEIINAQREGRADNARRGYMSADAAIMQTFGVGSAFSASIVLSMYVDTNVAKGFYVLPRLLWLVVPLHLFWQCRIWLAAARGQMTDDPILYAARDRASWLVAGLTAATFVVSTVGVPALAAWAR
jgi:4-hydroxybenzoate polyprenyltransferase/phosphoserine phosphatase